MSALPPTSLEVPELRLGPFLELQDVQGLVDFFYGLPPIVVYGVIALGSAFENIFPPVPSDTFVILGAVLSDRGTLQPAGVLLSAWIANVIGAMIVFRIAERRGPAFFQSGWGHRLLRPHQFERVAHFYDRHGLWAIFFSRFLPVLRVVIPTFAGFTHLGFVRTLIPVATASLLSNLAMLAAGIFASRNVGRLLDLLGQANAWLLAAAGLAFGGIIYWWVRSRRDGHSEEEHKAAIVDPGEPQTEDGPTDDQGPGA